MVVTCGVGSSVDVDRGWGREGRECSCWVFVVNVYGVSGSSLWFGYSVILVLSPYQPRVS